MTKDKDPFRVLTLDGGGMRGLYSAFLLDTLIRRACQGENNIDIGKGFDLIVGTSTGGILGTGLAQGIPIENIISLYEDHGDAIFTIPAKETNLIAKIFDYPTTAVAKMRAESLRIALEKQFKEVTIGQMWHERGIALCVPAVNMGTQKAWVFKTPHIEANDKRIAKNRDNNYKLVDVCLATSAAPTFFPLAVVDNPDQRGHHHVFADGGLWANNPALIGLIEALELIENDSERQVQIISIGSATSNTGRVIKKEDANFPLRSMKGKNDWSLGRGIIEAILQSQASSIEFMLNFILPHIRTNVEYIRIGNNTPSSEQEKHIGLDKADKEAIIALKDIAKDEVENNIFGINTKLSSDQRNMLMQIISSMPKLTNQP